VIFKTGGWHLAVSSVGSTPTRFRHLFRQVAKSRHRSLLAARAWLDLIKRDSSEPDRQSTSDICSLSTPGGDAS